jgi:hypothetical protein
MNQDLTRGADQSALLFLCIYETKYPINSAYKMCPIIHSVNGKKNGGKNGFEIAI